MFLFIFDPCIMSIYLSIYTFVLSLCLSIDPCIYPSVLSCLYYLSIPSIVSRLRTIVKISCYIKETKRNEIENPVKRLSPEKTVWGYLMQTWKPVLLIRSNFYRIWIKFPRIYFLLSSVAQYVSVDQPPLKVSTNKRSLTDDG